MTTDELQREILRLALSNTHDPRGWPVAFTDLMNLTKQYDAGLLNHALQLLLDDDRVKMHKAETPTSGWRTYKRGDKLASFLDVGNVWLEVTAKGRQWSERQAPPPSAREAATASDQDSASNLLTELMAADLVVASVALTRGGVRGSLSRGDLAVSAPRAFPPGTLCVVADPALSGTRLVRPADSESVQGAIALVARLGDRGPDRQTFIRDVVELDGPVWFADLAASRSLATWPPLQARFQPEGTIFEAANAEVRGEIWSLIVATNPEIARTVSRWLAEDDGPASGFAVRSEAGAQESLFPLGDWSETVRGVLTFARLFAAQRVAERRSIDSRMILLALVHPNSGTGLVSKLRIAVGQGPWVDPASTSEPWFQVAQHLAEFDASLHDDIGRPEPGLWSEDAHILLSHADHVARRVGAAETRVHDIVAALVLPPRGSRRALAHELLAQVVRSLTTLRNDMLAYLLSEKLSESEKIGWRELFSELGGPGISDDAVPPPPRAAAASVPPSSGLAWLTSDDPLGKADDLLKIEKDVHALCDVIAAKDVHPPLSIGLFGDWGAGKTFFMEKMRRRIDQLAETDHAHDGKSAYCGHVVQIEFNAWHYIDRSLWASLTSEIFEQLARALAPADDDPAHRKARLLAAVLKADNALADAERMKHDADRAVQDGHARLAQMEEAEKNLIAQLRPRELTRAVVGALQVSTAWRQHRKAIAGALHLSELQAAGAELQAELLDVQENFSWMRSLFIAVRRGQTALPWAVGAALAAGSGYAIYRFLPLETVDVTLAAAERTAATVVAVVASVVTPFLRRAKTILAEVREFQITDGAIIDASKQKRREEVETRQRELQAAAEEEHTRVERATRLVEDLQRQLDALRADRRLADFVAERRASADYSKHLGVIARARQDFERLSDLLAEARREAQSQTATSAPAKDASGPLVPRVDRIVLYIDDLDRCPENTVVEVLQAVHLLLAFPLFVVVVGVDSRWLLHSLRQHSAAFRSDESADDGMSNEERLHWQSTPLNYLEKIFQIPYSLRPMGKAGFGRLIDKLSVQDGSVTDLGAAAKTDEALERGSSPTAAGNGGPSSPGTPPTSSSAAPLTPADPGAVKADTSPAGNETKGAIDAPATVTPVGTSPSPAIAPNPGRLAISDHERSVMKALHLFVPTARATKRFVNVYRLLRAGVSENEATAFVGDSAVGEHRVALLLLAMLVGYPEEATDVLRLLLATQPVEWWTFIDALVKERTPPDNVDAEASSQESAKSATPPSNEAATSRRTAAAGPRKERWRRLERCLAAPDVRALVSVDLGSDRLLCWARRVARYSFQSSRVLANDDAADEETPAPLSPA